MDFKDYIELCGLLIALWTLHKGVREYSDQNDIRRYEKYSAMSERFDKTEEIQEVCKLLQAKKGQEPKVSEQNKMLFICFMEEIHFMINSGIMKEDIALYSFGYYARNVLEHEKFWEGLKPRSYPYYAHFVAFCKKAAAHVPDPGKTLNY